MPKEKPQSNKLRLLLLTMFAFAVIVPVIKVIYSIFDHHLAIQWMFFIIFLAVVCNPKDTAIGMLKGESVYKKMFLGPTLILLVLFMGYQSFNFIRDCLGYCKVMEVSRVTVDGYSNPSKGSPYYTVSTDTYSGLEMMEVSPRVAPLEADIRYLEIGDKTSQTYRLTILKHLKIIMDAELVK